MRIVLGNDSNKYDESQDLMRLSHIEALEHRTDIEFILMAHDDVTELAHWVRSLRADIHTYLIPIFSEIKPCDDMTCHLIDGFSQPFSELDDKAKQINLKIKSINKIVFEEELENRCLNYLFTRPSTCLDFILDINYAQLVRYPLVEQFITNVELALSCVKDWASQGMIESIAVTDEIQTCPHCHSGWLTYKNTCPDCHAVDISKQLFLHCFACGNTEPEGSFFNKDILSCPKCYTKLRQIGIDYDRPLEEYLCNANQHVFTEPQVVAQCLSCHRGCSPPELHSKKLSRYRLSRRGRDKIARKKSILMTDLKDHFNFVETSYFLVFLDWLINTTSRHKEFNFSLISLTVVNSQQLVIHYGVAKARQMLQKIFFYIRNHLRKTDLMTRSTNESITLLLTKVDSNKSTQIIANINDFIEQSSQELRVALSLKIDCLSSDEICLSEYDAKLLFAELKARSVADE